DRITRIGRVDVEAVLIRFGRLYEARLVDDPDLREARVVAARVDGLDQVGRAEAVLRQVVPHPPTVTDPEVPDDAAAQRVVRIVRGVVGQGHAVHSGEDVSLRFDPVLRNGC